MIQFVGCWGEKTGHRAGFFVFQGSKALRTACFVDGYNLFYGLVAGTKYKWLDLPALLTHILRVEQPEARLGSISFFTSGVKPSLATRGSLSKEAQDSYLRALIARGVSVYYGRHQLEPGNAPRFVDKKTPPSRLDQVAIWKLEEKETDVHIAVSMYRLASRQASLAPEDRIRQIVLVSADTDMTPALRALREDFPELRVGVILPHREGMKRTVPGSLKAQAHWMRHVVTEEELASHQFPDRVATLKKPARRPDYW
ncbi:6-hydroxy-3-succinoylpyridine 3-monooxygenase HspA [Pseudomonas fluorescens]|nr:6-hydroxy-3-succinoylpyridine 3-monooxygenase HspA [Pseudomonas fluorescens]